MRTIIRQTPPEGLVKWALFDREPLERWRMERVWLLGDAADPMLPSPGQGAAMGIEDGLAPARSFASLAETVRNYPPGRTDHFRPGRHVGAGSLGIMAYNPAAVAV